MGLCLPWPRAQAEGGHPSPEICSLFPASLDAPANKERVRDCPEVEIAQMWTAVVMEAHWLAESLISHPYVHLGTSLEVSQTWGDLQQSSDKVQAG